MPSSKPSSFALTSEGRVQLYSTLELLNMPEPEWLIDGIIPKQAFVVLYGPSGCGKSFVAIDIAMCVSSGLAWQSHEVDTGFAVYISAEGTSGIGQRAKAWLLANRKHADETNIAWAVESVPIYQDSEDLQALFDRFDELQDQPAIVVVDTLARCFEGDENDTPDMAAFVKGIDRLRNECGSTVLVVHHTNSSDSRERGNGSLRGAADTMIRMMPGILGSGIRTALRPVQNSFTFLMDKQKEALPCNIGLGSLVSVKVGLDAHGRDRTSGVVRMEWLSKEESDELA